MKTIKRLFLIGALALFAVVSMDAQRYYSKSVKDRVLANHTLFAVQIGDGDAGDTTDLSTSREYDTFSYDGINTFKVTKLTVGIQSGIGTDTLGIHVCFSDTIADATPSYLVTTATPLVYATASTVGQEITTFDDATIPAGSFVWVRLTNITTMRKPIELSITVTGHMQDAAGN